MEQHARNGTRQLREAIAMVMLSIMAVAGGARAQSLPAPIAQASAAVARTDGCATTLTFSPYAYLRDREVVRQTLRVDDLRSTRRRWQPAAITFGLGVASFALGAVFLGRASRTDVYKPAMDGAGVLMMPLGTLMMLVAGPLLGVRASRTVRLARAERALDAATREPSAPARMAR